MRLEQKRPGVGNTVRGPDAGVWDLSMATKAAIRGRYGLQWSFKSTFPTFKRWSDSEGIAVADV